MYKFLLYCNLFDLLLILALWQVHLVTCTELRVCLLILLVRLFGCSGTLATVIIPLRLRIIISVGINLAFSIFGSKLARLLCLLCFSSMILVCRSALSIGCVATCSSTATTVPAISPYSDNLHAYKLTFLLALMQTLHIPNHRQRFLSLKQMINSLLRQGTNILIMLLSLALLESCDPKFALCSYFFLYLSQSYTILCCWFNMFFCLLIYLKGLWCFWFLVGWVLCCARY